MTDKEKEEQLRRVVKQINIVIEKEYGKNCPGYCLLVPAFGESKIDDLISNLYPGRMLKLMIDALGSCIQDFFRQGEQQVDDEINRKRLH